MSLFDLKTQNVKINKKEKFMNLLKYKYPDTDFENIKEKDIIYFCRDALNYDYKYKSPRLSKEQIVLDKKKYENEILLLIKREFFKNSENWE